MLALVVGSATFQTPAEEPAATAATSKSAKAKVGAPKATGEVEIIWPGGKDKEIPPGEEKLAFAEFEAFPATDKKPPRGEFTYRVLNSDGTLHREIRAEVREAFIEVEGLKAWFVAEVVSDERLCNGGCGDDTTHDDGGCSGSDGTDDHGTPGGDTGGCGDDTTRDDGGCGDDGTHDDGGCAGGGSGGQGGPGGHISGKESRVGQIVVVKMHDKATPGAAGADGTPGDGITWKWFTEADVIGLLTEITVEPTGHLCKKTIIGGNLVVHVPGE